MLNIQISCCCFIIIFFNKFPFALPKHPHRKVHFEKMSREANLSQHTMLMAMAALPGSKPHSQKCCSWNDYAALQHLNFCFLTITI